MHIIIFCMHIIILCMVNNGSVNTIIRSHNKQFENIKTAITTLVQQRRYMIIAT